MIQMTTQNSITFVELRDEDAPIISIVAIEFDPVDKRDIVHVHTNSDAADLTTKWMVADFLQFELDKLRERTQSLERMLAKVKAAKSARFTQD